MHTATSWQAFTAFPNLPTYHNPHLLLASPTCHVSESWTRTMGLTRRIQVYTGLYNASVYTLNLTDNDGKQRSRFRSNAAQKYYVLRGRRAARSFADSFDSALALSIAEGCPFTVMFWRLFFSPLHLNFSQWHGMLSWSWRRYSMLPR